METLQELTRGDLFRCFGERPISTQYCRGSCLSLDNGWVRVDPEEDDGTGGVMDNISEGEEADDADNSAADLKPPSTTGKSNGRAEYLETSGSRKSCDFKYFFVISVFLFLAP